MVIGGRAAAVDMPAHQEEKRESYLLHRMSQQRATLVNRSLRRIYYFSQREREREAGLHGHTVYNRALPESGIRNKVQRERMEAIINAR